jgi:hypothetical protein
MEKVRRKKGFKMRFKRCLKPYLVQSKLLMAARNKVKM